ncbi:hypothetical protein [Planctomicrobium piriforme]|uniref:hypothetical protein n=1 Tax=Planctomicrobium piriforme TaxID=1576369 RepID=UPI000B843EB7|nr:hypothetical protein [Planctomicrobium piriforme]
MLQRKCEPPSLRGVLPTSHQLVICFILERRRLKLQRRLPEANNRHIRRNENGRTTANKNPREPQIPVLVYADRHHRQALSRESAVGISSCGVFEPVVGLFGGDPNARPRRLPATPGIAQSTASA